MLIYRLEDINGGGAYNGDNPPDLFELFVATAAEDKKKGLGVWNVEERRPSPLQDIRGFKHSSKYRFGFVDLDQLRSWFPRRALNLYRNKTGDYAVSVYEIDDHFAKVGDHQVAFEFANAKLVKKIPIEDVNRS